MSHKHFRPSRTAGAAGSEVLWTERLLTITISAGVVLIPLFILAGAHDSFRRPKELFLQGIVIVLAGILAGAAVLDRAALQRLPARRDAFIDLAIVTFGWALIATLFSTNRLLSFGTLMRIAGLLFLFVVTIVIAKRRSVHFAALIVLPAVVNALFCIVQETSIWNPFSAREGLEHHMRTTALIGNPNDIGTYLSLAGLTAFVAAVAIRGRWRLAYLAAAMVIFAGLVATQTLTAMLAFVVSVAVLMLRISWKRALIGIALNVLVLAAVIAGYTPYRARVLNIAAWARAGDYNAIVTNRLTAFAAATEMIRDRPLLGVGPGTFGWQYLPYKLRAEERYPPLRTAFNRGTNFGEVHNDHLQIAAEYGLPGYALLALFASALATVSFGRPNVAGFDAPSDERERFGRLLAAPFVVCVLLLALAQFPLQLAAVAHLALTLAALSIAWSRA